MILVFLLPLKKFVRKITCDRYWCVDENEKQQIIEAQVLCRQKPISASYFAVTWNWPWAAESLWWEPATRLGERPSQHRGNGGHKRLQSHFLLMSPGPPAPSWSGDGRDLIILLLQLLGLFLVFFSLLFCGSDYVADDVPGNIFSFLAWDEFV